VGIAGACCAGKNRVAAALEARGLPVLDVDRLGHACLESRSAEVFARFGPGARGPGGSVDRRALGAMVFRDRAALADLEAIVHPEANRMTLEWVAAQGGKACAVNAALLHKTAVFGRLDCVILVRAPWPARLLRARRRDGLPWIALLRRFASQRNFEAQYLAGNADIYRVENPGIWAPSLPRGPARGNSTLENRIEEILAKLGLPQSQEAAACAD